MTAQDPSGWTNICERCLRPYWIRASDAQASKSRRVVSRDDSSPHVCAPNAETVTVKRVDLDGNVTDTYRTEAELNGWRPTQGAML